MARGRPFEKGQKRSPKAGRKKGTPNKKTREIKEFALSILTGPKYVKHVQDMADEGKLPPHLETLLYHYAYGKPKDRVEWTGEDGGPVRFTLSIGGSDGHGSH